jgi:multicomponent Na+:H+ antiporter subunit F
MSGVEQIAVDVTLIALGAGFLLSAVRIAVGPTRSDRIVAADLSFFLLVGVVALLSRRLDAPSYLDVVLGAAIVGFLSTIALALLVVRGRP